jgi:glutamine amidotransferase
MIDIAVVDYGMGNLRSVSKALEHVAPNKNVVVTSNARDIAAAARVVFPGQGAMPDCMRELESRGLHEAVVSAAAHKPFWVFALACSFYLSIPKRAMLRAWVFWRVK